MQLITMEVRASLPGLYSQGDVEDPIVQVKFFAPWGRWTFYALEFDGDDTFFGFVVGDGPDCDELGYFSLSELRSVRHPIFCLGIERDIHFKPTPLSICRERHP